MSTPLPCGGAFILASNPKGEPSSTLGMSPDDDNEGGSQPGDEEVDMGLEADDEGDGEKDAPGDDSLIDPWELELLKGIINPVVDDEPPTAPKSGDKQGLTHLNSGSGSSDSSGKDLDAKGIHIKKKMATPTKALHPSKWSPEDINVVCQIRYKTDFDRFQTYHRNKIKPADIASINTKDHSAYIDVVKADPSSVVQKSIFSVAAYHEVLWLKGSDTSKFDKEVGTKFKKSAKTSRAPDTARVDIDWVMLVCQSENGINMAYFDPDGFGCPGTMGLWDLHSSNTLSRAKIQLTSGRIDANFCPLCTFWSTNNDTLNNHVCKHYKMGLTCHADGFMMASIAAMKAHMEKEHGYEGKRAGVLW